jgi:hypothetical protein
MLAVAAGLPADAVERDLASIENVQLHAYIYPDIPAMGAVKVDISGKVNGVTAKAGFDYKRP